MQRIFLFLLIFSLLFACKDKASIDLAIKDNALVDFVNPFIGTGGHGHTFPGATVPFGMMQLSPDTRLEGWDGVSGYHYSDSVLYGFSHTHLSGTGVGDYCDILLMPTNAVQFHNGADGKPGYRSAFSHAEEEAKPAYYAVRLEDTDIEVKLTTAARSGIHHYSFAADSKQVVMLDLHHRDKVLDSKLVKMSDTELQGYRFSEAWATDQRLFFNMVFSKPIKSIQYLDDKTSGEKVIAALEFDASSGNSLEVRIGISSVSEAGAKNNREIELAEKSFEDIQEASTALWEKELEKIVIESQDKDQKTIFYTALYHSMIAPNLYMDVDGKYRGMDLQVHQAEGYDYHTVFSLWDTYRATHPLYTIIDQKRTNDFINTFLAKYNEGGILPIWDLSACYTGCMIGYHGVSVISDAYQKGIRAYDVNLAYEASKHSAMQDHLGLDLYKRYGYIPAELESESVSKTLEYAYDDWAIAQMAKGLGKKADYKYFMERAQYYKNSYDPSTQFMRGRFQNTWFAPFDPYEVNFHFTEANSWQYSFYVPQDVGGFVKLLGGKKQLDKRLDALFGAKDQTTGRNQADITGLIGQYAHGNEPSHHMAYLYNFVNQPQKTQERVTEIMRNLYSNTPDGISGNEDCGQMSAWYVFSSLGFYPVTPGNNQYIIGSPIVEKATIFLENGKQFTVMAKGVSKTNKYIAKAILNGKSYPYGYISHQTIMSGGELIFEMQDSPSDWAAADMHLPQSVIDEHLIVPAPYISQGDLAFRGETEVHLGNADAEAKIYFALNGEDFRLYTSPIRIQDDSSLEVYATKDGKQSSKQKTLFRKMDENLSISLATSYANQYNAGGEEALIDGVLGAPNFKTGTWQGYYDVPIDAKVTLKETKTVKRIQMQFLQDQKSWIFYPKLVHCYVSTDGKHFEKIASKQIEAAEASSEIGMKQLTFDVNRSDVKAVRMYAEPLGALPKWHLGYGPDGVAWIFADEIIID
ncbi:MAG: GH92 family glycosyl hydrolase [Flavobacteriaceae bacterium]|nr:GH92 family glycosyl hydrolase [Flavobacteriaceae bacterium]